MQRYEVIAIVSPDVSEDDVTAVIDRSQKIINERSGVIAKIEKWGKRRLAYEIKKFRDGYYFLIDFAGDGAIVNEVERNYKIDDRVIKFMTVKKEGACTREDIEKEIAEAEARRAKARASADEQNGQSGQGTEAAPKKITTKEESSKKGE
ncbi:MAG TPA: 30S ribosomal protein S6 [Smithella sp.]|nr:30S ribosomal protein S6 [Smithella sp.]